MTVRLEPVAAGLDGPHAAPRSPAAVLGPADAFQLPRGAVPRSQRESQRRLDAMRERAEALRAMAEETKLRAHSLLCESRLLREAITAQCNEPPQDYGSTRMTTRMNADTAALSP